MRNEVIIAVIFCKNSGEMRWFIIFLRIHRNHRNPTKIHRIHRISCKNLHKKFDPDFEQNQKKFKNKLIYRLMSTCERFILLEAS